MHTQQKRAHGPFGNDKCGGFNQFKGQFGGNHPFKEMFARKINSHKPVNIVEETDVFKVKLYAAGLHKNEFKVEVKDQILIISYAGKADHSSDVIYQEFYSEPFERRFQLTEKILEDQVSAAYENGVLTVSLPKNPETNKPAQEIKIN